MDEDGYLQSHDQESGTGTGDGAEAEHRVHDRQQSATDLLLDGGTLDVHHDVDAAGAESVADHPGDRECVGAKDLYAHAEQDDAGRDHENADQDAALGPDAQQHERRDRQTDERGGARREQQNADLGIVNRERRLDRWHP